MLLEILPRFSISTSCYACKGSASFRQGKCLLENRRRLRQRSGSFPSETASERFNLPASLNSGFEAPTLQNRGGGRVSDIQRCFCCVLLLEFVVTSWTVPRGAGTILLPLLPRACAQCITTSIKSDMEARARIPRFHVVRLLR